MGLPSFSRSTCILGILVLFLSPPSRTWGNDSDRELGFQVKLEVIKQEINPKYCWFHPRAVAIPRIGKDGRPGVLVTIQKHLTASDHYSGLYMMRTDDLGATWTGPTEIPELAWRDAGNDVTLAVADVTPGWHPPTRKVIALGAQVRYNLKGDQLEDVPRANSTSYAIYDPEKNRWTGWQTLEVPQDAEFNMSRNACSQWLVESDGSLLVPLYHATSATVPYHVTVARYRFDGAQLKLVERGNTMSLKIARGLYEPSLTRMGQRYYLTLRNDERGYVTRSEDGLNFQPIQPWKFADGTDLGSYNTQQHWLSHSDGLFLAYTRRGANNDHIARHRAPLFLAQVDTDNLVVLKYTEQVLMPERGVMLGNFGACPVNERESWVTDSEYLVGTDQPHPRGADGSTFLARVIWSKPNRQALPPGPAQ